MLAAKERLCTKFLPNAKFYYGASTPLLCDGFVISSYRGSAADTGDGWVHSYCDDDLRVVFCRHWFCAWKGRVRGQGEATGLRLNPSTCHVRGLGLSASARFPELFVQAWDCDLRTLGVLLEFLDFETAETRASASTPGRTLTKFSSQACHRSASLILRTWQGPAKQET